MVLEKYISKCVFSLLGSYFPLEKSLALLNKLGFPSTKNVSRQVWLNLAKWFWRRFLNVVYAFLLFGYDLPKEIKSMWLSEFPFVNIWIPFIQRCFVSCMVEIDQVVLEKKMKIRKVYAWCTPATTMNVTNSDRSPERLSWCISPYHSNFLGHTFSISYIGTSHLQIRFKFYQ